jgi:hypothetical protein
MLRMVEALFPAAALLRAKALESVAKAYEVGDLAYGVGIVVLLATEGSLTIIPTTGIANLFLDLHLLTLSSCPRSGRGGCC